MVPRQPARTSLFLEYKIRAGTAGSFYDGKLSRFRSGEASRTWLAHRVKFPILTCQYATKIFMLFARGKFFQWGQAA
jgi:hypothetical protein